MSYILDALRRADAERERGAVPSLSSQQHAMVEDDAVRPARSRALVWAAAGLAVALLAALAWNLFGDHAAPPARPIAEGSVAPAQTPGPVLLPTTPSVAGPQSAATTVPQDTAPPTPGVPATEKAAPPPVAAAPRPTHSHAEPKHTARRAAESGTVSGGEPAAKSGSGQARVYTQAELPEEVRRDLPKLTIGGASYSGDAASRMVMINGQVFHEGDQLGPQLVLERIKLKSAVLSYKGYRYEVTF
jgi:general secretion pathway protein B